MLKNQQTSRNTDEKICDENVKFIDTKVDEIFENKPNLSAYIDTHVVKQSLTLACR